MGVNCSYHMEMRKMPGMSGEVDEHPASSNESNIIAIAIRIMRTWWKPRNGINRCMLTANRKFAIMNVSFLQLRLKGFVFSLRPQRAG